MTEQTIETLDSVFMDKEGETEEVLDKEETTDEEQETESTGDKQEDEETGKPPGEEKKSHVPMSAFLGVKDELKYVKERLKEYEDQYAPKDEDEPDPVEDPQGYKTYIRNKIAREEMTERITSSREKAIESYDDYVEMEQLFAIMAGKDQSLADQMRSNPDPAGFAYRTAKAYRTSERDKLKAEILAELKAESTQKEAAPKAEGRKTALQMPNLTNAAAVGKNTNAKVEEQGLEDIFAGSPY